MDLVDHVNKLVKVRIEKLESKIRSKKDLYYIWSNVVSIYLINVLRSILFAWWESMIDQIFKRCSFWEEKG